MTGMTDTVTIELARFKELMLNRCGLSFEKERAVTLASALQRRMKSLGMADPDVYHLFLNANET